MSFVTEQTPVITCRIYSAKGEMLKVKSTLKFYKSKRYLRKQSLSLLLRLLSQWDLSVNFCSFHFPLSTDPLWKLVCQSKIQWSLHRPLSMQENLFSHNSKHMGWLRGPSWVIWAIQCLITYLELSSVRLSGVNGAENWVCAKKQRTIVQTQLLPGGSPADIYQVYFSFFLYKDQCSLVSSWVINGGKKTISKDEFN